MKLRRSIQTLCVLLPCVAVSAHADDLMQVYQQAVQSDQIFAQAQSTWQSQKMNLPIAESGYLPQLGIVSNAGRNYLATSPTYTGYPNASWQYGYTLTLSQQVFNFAVWEQIKGASANVKAATATYLAAQQSLMQRTAQAYFDVLQAYDQLRYTIANKRAVWQQFLTAREQFRVGLIAITDEYDARSRYDQVVAQQISVQNKLNIQLENLRVITGRDYPSLKALGKQLPLVTPKPNKMEQWVSVADGQNYDIKAQSYSVIAAMDNIKQQAAGGYPSLSVQAGGGQLRQNYVGLNVAQNTANLGLQLAYNPVQGGLVTASTKQARYNYVTASAALEQTHRQVVNQARSSFLSVLSYMSQVKADQASIVSARNALAATEAGFKVGTRTMVDVLNDLSALYASQQEYANDQYSYINNLIALKAAAGTLNVQDLQNINKWLGQSVAFPEQTSVGTIPTEGSHSLIKTDDIDVKPNKNEVMPPKTTVNTAPVAPVSVPPAVSTPAKTEASLPSPASVAPQLQTVAPRMTMLPQPAES